MVTPNIETLEEVTDEQVQYLAGLAENLSTQNDFTIQNFSDSLITSPDVQTLLKRESSIDFLQNEVPDDAAFDVFNPLGASTDVFALSFPQENMILAGLWPKIRSLFTSLRRKVKRIFCKVISMLSGEKELDLKSIIKDVLIALIPAFAATTGLLAVALPIAISLTALVLKYGVTKICPV